MALSRIAPGADARGMESRVGSAGRQREAIPVGLDRHGLEVLSNDECLELLAASPVGRLGFSSGVLPVIFPVNIELHGWRAYFRVLEGEKLRAAHTGAVACIEVDEYDTFEHRGWSVLATGRLRPASGDDEVDAAPSVRPWARTEAGHLVSLDIELLSGRRIRRPVPN
jgi:nitroimidazol reductase NimA-like FMN-containing flavoprotein (pyridoxamine 5'-phosphate oxidase superfamily)